MPESLTLTPSPWKWLFVFLMSLGSTVIGILIVRDGDAVGWFVVTFFGVGVLLSFVQFLPRASYLHLDSTGFTICSLFRKTIVPWKDVQNFGTFWVYRAGRFVGFNYKFGVQPSGLTKKLAVGLSGFEAGVPDTYGKSADELVCLLEQWRCRYGQ